jgi:hypothetical protein
LGRSFIDDQRVEQPDIIDLHILKHIP